MLFDLQATKNPGSGSFSEIDPLLYPLLLPVLPLLLLSTARRQLEQPVQPAPPPKPFMIRMGNFIIEAVGPLVGLLLKEQVKAERLKASRENRWGTVVVLSLAERGLDRWSDN